jgi:uncharacterized protein YndB with AHSA1/START domain
MHENVKISVKVNAPVDKVWNALTNKEQMKNWYFDIPDLNQKKVMHSIFLSRVKREFHHHCEIAEVVPNEKLKHSWTYPDITKEKTLVKWELKPEKKVP